MKLFETGTCRDLPPVRSQLADRILQSDRTEEAHRRLFASLDALHCLEAGGELIDHGKIGAELTIAAWNMERCLYPEQSADLLRSVSADIILVSEMDNGMARTHQRNTTRALADNLGMRYAFGLEFFEIGVGSKIERNLAADDFNEKGWHGNAVLSRVEPIASALIRLDNNGHWFCQQDATDYPRIGGRNAVAMILPTEAGKICVVSTHLESNAGIAMRQSQMERLIAALDVFAEGLPVIIGGDLNTGNNIPGFDWRDETLYAAAERHEFSWSNNADGTTTRSSLLTPAPGAIMKLDWFASRGFSGLGARIVPALDDNGKVLSDHELIIGQFARL